MPCESKNAFLAPFYAQESRRDERKRRFMSIKWRIHLIDGAVQQPLTHPQRKPLGQKTSLDILGMRIREIMIKSAFFMDESARVVLY
jgi:hypothetical protein